MQTTYEQPFLAIKCMVYNQAPYIRQCLDGFVMQQTNFPFIAIVHDDASTDGSASIIQEYADRYPEIIRPLFEEENQYSKPGMTIGRMLLNMEVPESVKYIAICEGDDYWTDPLKLQKQVDFLECHPDFSICHHRIRIFNQDTNLFEEPPAMSLPNITSIDDLVRGNHIINLSAVYRNVHLSEDDMALIANVYPADYPSHLVYAQYGKIYKQDDIMGVYRHGSGVWSSVMNTQQTEHTLNMLRRVILHFDKRLDFTGQYNHYLWKLYNDYYLAGNVEAIFDRTVEDITYSREGVINFLMYMGREQIRNTKGYQFVSFLQTPIHFMKKNLSKK